MEIEKFFYDNKTGFDTLVWLHRIFNKFFQEQNEAVKTYNSLISCYKEFKKGFQEEQSKKIEGYLSSICDKTGIEKGKKNEPNKWWLHCYGRVLGLYWGKVGDHRIGIECVFEKETSEKPLGEFHIYVASWDKSGFGDYEPYIRKDFPEKDPKNSKTANNRTFILVNKHKPEETEKIIDTLLDTYYKLKKIIE